LKIVVMGTGGLGGYFGFLLARAGNDVHFVARGARLDAMRQNGLRLITNDEDSTIQVKASDNPRDAGTAELVLFCVKTYDTDSAARSILPILDRDSSVLTFQNGIGNIEMISDVVGRESVLPGVAWVASEVQAPGVIHLFPGGGEIIFGEVNGQKTARVERINQAFRAAGFGSEISTDISKLLWQKMIWFCGFAGMTSILRLPLGKVMSYPETREMFKQLMEEADVLAKAKGTDVGRDYVQGIMDVANRAENAPVTSSMMRDLLAGRKLELDALNGNAIRMGKEYGIATPMNSAVYAALRPYVNGPP
jgi:2-dehydropantoate 2-reductase